MTQEELLERMWAVLAEERAAIRRLDVSAVTRAAEVKSELLEQVRSAPAPERAALVAALGRARGDLRQNLLLLAHARSFLHEALASCARSRRSARLRAEL